MASGVKVGDDVKEVYQKICMESSKTTKYKYAIFRYSSDAKFIEVEDKVAESGDFDYDSIVSALPSSEPRFFAYDFDHLDKEGHKTSSVIVISWCPEGCSIRHKLIQGTSINGLRMALSINNKFVEAGSLDDITKEAINDRFKWPSS